MAWFQVTGSAPEDLAGAWVEIVVDLGAGETRTGLVAEGRGSNRGGRPLKGLAPSPEARSTWT